MNKTDFDVMIEYMRAEEALDKKAREKADIADTAPRRYVEQLADAMGIIVSTTKTWADLLADVALNMNGARWAMRLSSALGEMRDAIREKDHVIRERDQVIERLKSEVTASRLTAALLAATEPSSTESMRAQLRQDLVSRGLLPELPPEPVDIGPTNDLAQMARTVDVGDPMRILARSVDELDLSVRASNCLQNAGVRTLGDLARMTSADVLRIKWSTGKVVREIRDELAKVGLSLAPNPSLLSAKTKRRATRGAR